MSSIRCCSILLPFLLVGYVFPQDAPGGTPARASFVINNSQYLVEGEYIEQNGKFRTTLPLLPEDHFLGVVQDLRNAERTEKEIVALVQVFVVALRTAYREEAWEAVRQTFLDSEADLLQWYLEPFDISPHRFSFRIGAIKQDSNRWLVPIRLIAESTHAIYTLQVVQHESEWRIEDILGSTDFLPFVYESDVEPSS